MNKGMMTWGLVVVAFLVGLYAGYAYEKNKFVGITNNLQADFQRQLNDAKKVSETVKPTGTTSDVTTKAKSGDYQVDASGMTLYTFDKDTNGKSNCEGDCAVKWPPYILKGEVPSSMPEHLGTIKRSDDATQYTWDGKPLYYFSGDKNAGDTTGDGVGGVWHLAK